MNTAYFRFSNGDLARLKLAQMRLLLGLIRLCNAFALCVI